MPLDFTRPGFEGYALAIQTRLQAQQQAELERHRRAQLQAQQEALALRQVMERRLQSSEARREFLDQFNMRMDLFNAQQKLAREQYKERELTPNEANLLGVASKGLFKVPEHATVRDIVEGPLGEAFKQAAITSRDDGSTPKKRQLTSDEIALEILRKEDQVEEIDKQLAGNTNLDASDTNAMLLSIFSGTDPNSLRNRKDNLLDEVRALTEKPNYDEKRVSALREARSPTISIPRYGSTP